MTTAFKLNINTNGIVGSLCFGNTIQRIPDHTQSYIWVWIDKNNRDKCQENEKNIFLMLKFIPEYSEKTDPPVLRIKR